MKHFIVSSVAGGGGGGGGGGGVEGRRLKNIPDGSNNMLRELK